MVVAQPESDTTVLGVILRSKNVFSPGGFSFHLIVPFGPITSTEHFNVSSLPSTILVGISN